MIPIVTDEERAGIVAKLLGVPAVQLRPIKVGGNSRLFCVEGDGPAAVAKWYFDHGHDRRDRQNAEWAFLRHAEARGLKNVPRPLQCDGTHGVTLMSRLEGRHLVSPPEQRHVIAAARFVADLNTADMDANTDGLPVAAEGGFSFAAHSAILTRRIDRLASLSGEQELVEAAARLVEKMRTCHERWCEHVARCSTELSASLPETERCISPSDFGFHNVLESVGGGLMFLDFEYAGWDDPAKLICDFFWQPAVPVDEGYQEHFASGVLCNSRTQTVQLERIRLLDPLFGLRWCCIILNPFLPDWATRQIIAKPGGDIATVRCERLERAHTYLDRVRTRVDAL